MKPYIMSGALFSACVSFAFFSTPSLSVASDTRFSALSTANPLEGTWMQPCRGGSIRREVIANGRAALTEASYSDASCTTPQLTIVNEGPVSVMPNPLPLQPAPGQVSIGQVDFIFDSVTLTLLSPTAVQFYNSHAICGDTHWAIHQTRDITGKRCAFYQVGHDVQVPRAGDRRFGIYRVDGRVDGETLYFGQLSPEKNGQTPEARPTEFDPRGYLRQN